MVCTRERQFAMSKSITIISVTISLLYFGCKPDEPCNPTINYVDTKLMEFMPDVNYSKIVFKNSLNESIVFTYSYYYSKISDSPNPCNPKGEYISLNYSCDVSIEAIKYQVDAGDDIGLHLIFGNPYTGACHSPFRVVITDTANVLDSLALNGEIFKDVQYVPTVSTFCINEAYYSKIYGVVAFKWKDDWYVLEKDSLQ